MITPNEDSVKEVKVVANNYDAENGRYSGGSGSGYFGLNGTNEFHGSAFIKIDRPGLNAYNSCGAVLFRAVKARRKSWQQISYEF